jgi:type VI protein secretion system component VasK
MNTEFFCGQVGCAGLGMAFIVAILILVLIGWLYELWRRWAAAHLESIELDIQRMRHRKKADERERALDSKDRQSA